MTNRYHADRAFDADTRRNDAAALVFLIDTTGQGDDGHGGTVNKPAAWDDWDATRRQRWAGAVCRRVATQGSRMGRTTHADGQNRTGGAHHADLTVAIDYADPAPSVLRQLVARETVKATMVLADPTDRATIFALAEAIGARVWETDTSGMSHRVADATRKTDPRSGLPWGTMGRVGAILGISGQRATDRLARMRANVGPVVEALRTSGKLRADAVQRSAVLAALDSATVSSCGI